MEKRRFDREASRIRWANWDEPLSETEVEQMVDSEHIDHLLYDMDSLIGGLPGEDLGPIRAKLEDLRASIEFRYELARRSETGGTDNGDE